MYMCFK